MPADHTEQLIAALSDRAAYAHRPGSVDFIQTHISLVFLAGDRVYKVKKAVDLGFLDFTRLEDRRRYCNEEVRLNRRLAPDVYLGVAEIVRDLESGRIDVDEREFSPTPHSAPQGRGEMMKTIDYAVVMKRLPADGMLDQVLARGEADESIVERIADLLVPFHAACATGPGVDEHAEPAELRRQSLDNFRSLESFIDHDASGRQRIMIDHVREWVERFFDVHLALLRERIERGRIREGHGDLHARNICIVDAASEERRCGSSPSQMFDSPEIIIYDCIEFSRAFRCRDVACEIAFLAMDLDFHGRADLSDRFVDRYIERSGDEQILKLIPFYKAHFAIVRAKVEALRSMEREVEAAQQGASHDLARAYVRLAACCTLPAGIILMCGLPGTGKSHLARRLAIPLRASVLQSDVIRKELAGLDPTSRAGSDGDERGIYAREMTQRTYSAMRDRARAMIEAGRSVIVDATLPSHELRRPFVSLAESLGVPWVIVWTTATDEIVRARMKSRQSDRREPSDADWEVYRRAKDRFESPDEVDSDRVVRVDAVAAEADACDAAVAALCGQVPLSAR